MQASKQALLLCLLAGIILALLIGGIAFGVWLSNRRRREKRLRDQSSGSSPLGMELLRIREEIKEQKVGDAVREIHDNISQLLSVIRLWLASLPVDAGHPAYSGLGDSRKLLDEVIRDLAGLTRRLREDTLDESGLAEAIRLDIADRKKFWDVAIRLSVEGNEFHPDAEQSLCFFRIYQELMHNIFQHARAKNILIGLRYGDDGRLGLFVEDDGMGFDVNRMDSLQAEGKSGIKNIIKRSELIGAEFSLDSQPGQGTRIGVEIHDPAKTKSA